MKEIMAKQSTITDDGVANFSYIPVKHREKYMNVQLSLLSLYERPLDALGKELIDEFKGKTLTVKEIFDMHHIWKPFTLANYKEALRRLEEDGLILADPPSEKRRLRKGVRTMGDTVKITFLNQNGCSS